MPRRIACIPAQTISGEQAASFVRSGMWLDYGVALCQPDVFDKALAARRETLENVKIRSCLSMRPRAVVEDDPDGKHFFLFSWHFSGYDRKKHDAGRCNYMPLNLGEVPTTTAGSLSQWTWSFLRYARWTRTVTSTSVPPISGTAR